MWSQILRGTDKETLREALKKLLGEEIEKDEFFEKALDDVPGLANELLACYVLVDHKKPFLPFAIMQAPITPSYIKPGAASGDLYLFEENLVVDVKRGWVDSETGYPTYYYGEKGLSHDLKSISDLHALYGIRKGIGVVAEDEDSIYFAVYVPWRRWQRDGPLLFLKSVKSRSSRI